MISTDSITRNSAIRRLLSSVSNKHSISEKLEAIEFLKANGSGDELAIRTLILALGEKEINTNVSKAISDLLKNADKKEDRDLIMRYVTAHVFDYYFDSKFAAHQLFDDIIEVAKEGLPDTGDYISMLTFMAGNSGRKIEMVNDKLAKSLINFTNSDFLPESQRSKKAFVEFNAELVIRVLLEPVKATNKYLLQILKRFGKCKIDEVALDVVAAHATLFSKMTFKDDSNQEVIDQALDNLLSWSNSLMSDKETALSDRIAIEQWISSSPDAPIEISQIVIQRVAYNYILLNPLTGALVNDFTNLADKGKIFAILSNIDISRKTVVLNRICDYIKTIISNPNELNNFPLEKAIDFLEKHTVGLHRFLNLTEKEEKQIFGNNPSEERLRIKANSLGYATIINETLISIIKASLLDDDSRKRALTILVELIPHELLGIIENLKPSLDEKEPLRITLYNALGKIKYVDSLPLLLNRWQERWANSNEENHALLDAIGEIGTDKMLGTYSLENDALSPDLLLKDAFEETNESLKEKVNTLLYNKGFGAEIDREKIRRDIIQKTTELNQTAQTITENEAKARNLILEMNNGLGLFSENRFLMKRFVYELDAVATDKSLDLLETSVDATKVKRKLNVLQKKAAKHHDEINEVAEKVEQERDIAHSLDKDIKQIDQAINKIKDNIRSEQNRIESADSKHQKAERTIYSAERNINSLKGEISKYNRQVNSAFDELENLKGEVGIAERNLRQLRNASNSDELKDRISIAKSKLKTVKKNASKKEKSVRNLRGEINTLQGKEKKENNLISKAKSNQRNAQQEINQATYTIESLSQKIENLSSKRKKIPSKIKQSENKISDYENKISQHRLGLDEILRKIAELREESKQVQNDQRKIVNEFDSESKMVNDKIKCYREKAEAENRRLHEQTVEFNETENKIKKDSEVYQTLLQLISETQQAYDENGERTYIETNIANNTHVLESREKRILKIDEDLRNHLFYRALVNFKTNRKFIEKNPKANHIINSPKKHISHE